MGFWFIADRHMNEWTDICTSWVAFKPENESVIKVADNWDMYGETK